MNLTELLEYELNSAIRYQRYLSVAIIASNKTFRPELIKLMNKQVRSSDAAFFSGNAVVLLMAETELTDALHAINRHLDHLPQNDNMLISAAAYPKDGLSDKELMQALAVRLNAFQYGAFTSCMNSLSDATNCETLFDYEFSCAMRYRRFLAVVIVACVKTCNPKEQDLLRQYIRSCDAVFRLNDNTAILMGETDLNGSRRAVDRYLKHLPPNVDLRFAAASYPQDGSTKPDLKQKLDNRITEARRGQYRSHVFCTQEASESSSRPA